MRFVMLPYPLKRLPRILGKPFRKALARPLAVLDVDVLVSFQIVIAFLFWERSQERVLDRVMLVIFGILTSLPGFSELEANMQEGNQSGCYGGCCPDNRHGSGVRFWSLIWSLSLGSGSCWSWSCGSYWLTWTSWEEQLRATLCVLIFFFFEGPLPGSMVYCGQHALRTWPVPPYLWHALLKVVLFHNSGALCVS